MPRGHAGGDASSRPRDGRKQGKKDGVRGWTSLKATPDDTVSFPRRAESKPWIHDGYGDRVGRSAPPGEDSP